MPISDWKIKQIIFGQALEEIEELFKFRNLTFMPIKGAYLIMGGLAASIPDRQIRDIDLLIPEEFFDETCDWFSTLPNVSEHPNYWNFERSFVYTMQSVAVYCEFHRLINFPARFLLPNKTLFSNALLNSESTVFPDPVDALLIHICHMLPHVGDGYSEQSFQEIGILISQSGFSWEEFWARAKETGIVQFILLIFDIYNRTQTDVYVYIPYGRSWYVRSLVNFNIFLTLRNSLLRKLLFEVAFVKDVWWLFWYKKNNNQSTLSRYPACA